MITGPKCYRCGDSINAHRHGTGPCSACGCEGHIWPGSLQAAGYDLNRAVGDLWREVSAPFARLLDRITRRRP